MNIKPWGHPCRSAGNTDQTGQKEISGDISKNSHETNLEEKQKSSEDLEIDEEGTTCEITENVPEHLNNEPNENKNSASGTTNYKKEKSADRKNSSEESRTPETINSNVTIDNMERKQQSQKVQRDFAEALKDGKLSVQGRLSVVCSRFSR